MSKCYIFDIDGCVMPSVFPNNFYDTEQEKRIVVEEVNKKGKDIQLYPEFIDYYNKNCQDEFVFFVTGRQRDCFSELTKLHLNNIHYNIIYYFPSHLKHTFEGYNDWKFKVISSIIERYIDIVEEIKIYDDNVAYYERTLKWLDKHIQDCILNELENVGFDFEKPNIYFLQIDDPKHWKDGGIVIDQR